MPTRAPECHARPRLLRSRGLPIGTRTHSVSQTHLCCHFMHCMSTMLNYAVYANLCLRDAENYAKYAKLRKLCLMLRQCDYAEKQCWHNRAGPTRRPAAHHLRRTANTCIYLSRPVTQVYFLPPLNFSESCRIRILSRSPARVSSATAREFASVGFLHPRR